MPGRPLVTLYDSSSLRVTVSVPRSAALGLQEDPAVRIQLPGLPANREWVTPSRTVVLPTVDPGTHSVQLRLELPSPAPGTAGHPTAALAPGLFARAGLPCSVGAPARLNVPARSGVRHTQMTGLYVVGADGRPVLRRHGVHALQASADQGRQARLGPVQVDSVEILTGVSAGERGAFDPQAAARAR